MWEMKLIAFRTTPLPLVALSLVAGCGGGVNGSSNVQGAIHQGSAGLGTFSYQGNPKPLLTISSGTVTSATMAGASFSSLAVHPNSNLANTNLIWSMSVDGQEQVFKFNYPNGPIQAVTNTFPGYMEPSETKYGQVICISSGGQALDQMVIDGTHLKTISTGSPYEYYPQANPAATTIAYVYNEGLWTCPAAGGSSTKIQGAAGLGFAWSPTGSSLAYIILNGTSDTYHVMTTPVTGGTPTDITPAGLASSSSYYPSWSPNGDLAVGCSAGNGSIAVLPATGTIGSYYLTTPSGDTDVLPAFSPDGSKIAFYRTNTNGAQPGIYVEDTTGINQQLVATLPSNASGPDNLSWSPFPSPVTYVPNSSFYASAISGFILTQNGTQFGSLLGFIAKTPSAATISSSATQGGQSLVFTLSADAITNIVYTNSYFTYGTTVTPPASTPSALVSVDAVTGAVDTVATAARPLAKFTASTRSVGQNLVYDGPFTAVYGAKGNRLDTNGASQVVIDGKTGKLVSFQ